MKVTLLGDSIRLIGYGTRVPEILGEDFEVFQPEVNCRFSKFTLRGLHDWAKDMEGSEIVHWNNGLWDVCRLFDDETFASDEEYVKTMLKIADILTKRYNKVIFATTTPVTEKHEFNRNEDIERFNAKIVPLLEEKGVIINDLYSLVASDIDKYILKEDNIHLTKEGIEACANQVAEIIRKVSEK